MIIIQILVGVYIGSCIVSVITGGIETVGKHLDIDYPE